MSLAVKWPRSLIIGLSVGITIGPLYSGTDLFGWVIGLLGVLAFIFIGWWFDGERVEEAPSETSAWDRVGAGVVLGGLGGAILGGSAGLIYTILTQGLSSLLTLGTLDQPPAIGAGVVYAIVIGIGGALLGGLVFWLGGELLDGVMAKREAEQRTTGLVVWSWKRIVQCFVVGFGGAFSIAFSVGLVDGLIELSRHGFYEGLVGAPVFGLIDGVLIGPLGGVVYGLVDGLIGTAEAKIRPAEVVVWSWKQMGQSLVSGFGIGMFFGGLYGLYAGFTIWLVKGLSTLVLQETAFFWLLIGPVIAFGFGLLGGVSSDTLDEQKRIRPNQGIRRSIRNGLFIGLAAGMVAALLPELVATLLLRLELGLPLSAYFVLVQSLLLGVVYGLVLGLRGGGFAGLQHGALRWLLWRSGVVPRGYARFLDYAAERILLRKVGGGYIFVHRLLMEYFANAAGAASALSPPSMTPAQPPIQAAPEPVLAQAPALPSVVQAATSAPAKPPPPEPTTAKDWLDKGRAAASGKKLATLSSRTGGARAVAWSPDGQRLASDGSDGTVFLWDTASGKKLATLKGHTSVVHAVAWSPDGQRLASASFDKTVRLWDVASGERLATLSGHAWMVFDVAWSPDGQRLASASYDQTVRLWDTVTCKEITTLSGHTREVWGVAWSPNGQRLASASLDKTVRLWDGASGNPLAILSSHTSLVYGVAWSPDGQRLASAGGDQTVRLWDGASGNPLATLSGHSREVWNLAWSPDGTRLASAGGDGTVRIWKV